jgi:hypothetical protein
MSGGDTGEDVHPLEHGESIDSICVGLATEAEYVRYRWVNKSGWVYRQSRLDLGGGGLSLTCTFRPGTHSTRSYVGNASSRVLRRKKGSVDTVLYLSSDWLPPATLIDSSAAGCHRRHRCHRHLVP